MFKKLEIEKKENIISVYIEIEKKINKKTPILYFSWKEAQAKAKEKYPDLEIGKPLEYKQVLCNKSGDKLEETWNFPVIQKQETSFAKQETSFAKQELQKPPSFSIGKKKNKNRFTAPSKPATVEKTEQSVSDQPAIVQEPTE